MADFENMWVFDLEQKIFTIIKTRVTKALKTKYPSITFTTTNISEVTKYPSIYIHELGVYERLNDMENEVINAVDYSMQIEVYSNKSQEVVKEVAASVVSNFKKLGFTIRSFPEFQNQTTIYKSVMRVNRVIGGNDILN